MLFYNIQAVGGFDLSKRIKQKFSPPYTKINIAQISAISACLVALVVLFIFLGVFGLKNPDKASLNFNSAKFEELDKQDKNDYVNVHARFVKWFVWGFLIYFMAITSALLVQLGVKISKACGSACCFVLTCGNCCSILAWYMVGIVWRFNHNGMYASGDIVPVNKTDKEWRQELYKESSLY